MGTGYDAWYPEPLPEYPKKHTNKWGYDYWFMYDIDQTFGCFGKVLPDGHPDITTLHVMRYDEFPDWEAK